MKLSLIIALAMLPLLASATENRECVILLHGLCRTSRSMIPMEQALSQAGYKVLNVDYPSRSNSVEQLSEIAVGRAVSECQREGATTIHFVTHSLGGLLVRSYLARHTITNLGRVVMLGPPNQGTEVVDKVGSLWLFKKICGPTGSELGTGTDSLPGKLGPADFSVGVIAGNRSINWLHSLMIPGSDDGVVAVERTKLAGMADHIILRTSHPFLLRNRTSFQQTITFLRTSRFDRQLL